MQLFLYRSFPRPRYVFEFSRVDSRFQRKIFEIRRSSQLFRTSGLFAHFNLLRFSFSLYRSFFALNRPSLARLRVFLSSGSRGFISRSFSKFVRSCALAIITALSRILCLASSLLLYSHRLSFCVLSRSVRFFRRLLRLGAAPIGAVTVVSTVCSAM